MTKYLTATEFGAAVGRSEQTVLRWAKEGRIKTVSVGGRKLFKSADVAKGIELAKETRGRVLPDSAAAGND